MKHSLLSLAVVGAMFFTSCSSEETVAPANDGNVTFSVSLPGQMQSRAYSDGTKATALTCYAYDQKNGNEVDPIFTTTATMEGLKATVTFDNLISGRTYDFVFVAVADDSKVAYNKANRTITVDYTKPFASNDEQLDAFYKTVSLKITGAMQETVELRRPYAQLNIGTADIDEYLTALGANATMPTVGVKVTNVYSSFNLMTGEVTGTPAEVTFNAAAIPDATKEPFPYEETLADNSKRTFDYLAMNYLLVGANKDLVDVTMTVGTDEYDYANVPVQRNYRTNIYGSLLTDPATFNVIIVPGYEDKYLYNEPVSVSTVKDFVEAVKTPGAVVRLEENMEIAEAALELNNDVIIDLNGKTLKTNGVTTTGRAAVRSHAVIIGTGAKVSFKNGKIDYPTNYIPDVNSALILVDGDSATVELTDMDMSRALPVWVAGKNNKVTINSGTFKTTDDSQSVYLSKEATGSKVIINGGEFYSSYTDKTSGKVWTGFTLNIQNSLLKGQKPKEFIEVRGGKFINFNPADSKVEDPTANYVAEGFKVVESNEGEDKVYIVVQAN